MAVSLAFAPSSLNMLKEIAEEPPFDPSQEFNEIIKTSNGNEFYVVQPITAGDGQDVDAAEPARQSSDLEAEAEEEIDGGDEGEGEEEAAFLTEVEGQDESGTSAAEGSFTPDYIKSIDIPEDVIIRVKKAIRLNFLDHLDSWCEQAVERSDSVVIAKCEELNSELDLRLHLHQPRPRRAELDVHNVRAAELVLHAERVVRHCSGMEQSLAELGTKFKAMSHEHNKLANKFRADIEALEIVFVNATKSARLVKLQNQVSVELDKFMSVIRASLRQFRQHLDQTLQMLRESNARFIKSFKVFSEGGNFCPEEIEEHRKKLEKMSAMIDSTEGSIMSDLEGMESRRLDTATKIAVEFEDRFKSHMSDLVFIERVARWLTNTQVKIKAEVANSNGQAQKLVHMLDTLERRVDACARPNLDKEQITASQLNQSLFGIFEAFVARSEYLNCIKPGGSQGGIQTGPATSAKVGFSAESPQQTGGKAGKGAEDPSVNVIKSILNSPTTPKERTQRSKLRFGIDADLDGEGTTAQDSLREKSKSAMSQASSKGSEASKSTRKTAPAAGENLTRRTPSGHRRSSKPSKFDRKSLEKMEDIVDGEGGEAENFMSSIQKTLREARDGLMTTSEVFYRQKGTRPVTRPQALQETHEQCADIIAAKLQSYAQQADQYHNQCLQELRAQLVRFEQLSAHVPSLVIADLLREEVKRLQDVQAEMTTRFQATLDQLAGRQQSNLNELRPVLGHPNHSDQLAALCEQEVQRHDDYTEAVNKHTIQRQECALQESTLFMERMVKTAELQLLQYDGMLVVDDVEKGRVEPTLYPTSELIRRMNAGEPLEDDEDKGALPRGKASWIGIPSNQFVIEGRPSRLQVTPTVNTRKTTLAHSAVIKARDKAYEDYREQFERTLKQIEDEKERLILSEQRWEQAWDASVDKVRRLYQKE
ncbi:coiled-coil domain-containing protein 180-like [Plakobranchus ocellatus]|uniref:Coiled-coil domain-containing protein 180-like n=1 Tax=Plakobranchus ocellatus TaxID=259542 RepID=A0AAV4BK80_9GAST|nr:coiled-coil domain-containing protein 180-like [Plakobranchus ocellatus]